jgi:ribosomal protein S17E
MAVQFSRGCPFDCEFCDITKLFGRVPRTKTNAQFLAEFDRLYELGWRDEVFVVDDNFIGNKRDAMRLLPAIAAWQQEHNYPFGLFTETSVNLVEIPGMLDGMADAGFIMTFIGIESPNDAALEMTVKKQNTNREESARDYLLRAVQTIQSHGIEVTAGFIIGLDQDTEFQSHIDFIQQAGIPQAMTGLLTALKKTNLYNRLEKEGRLLHESTGNNVSVELNFVPELDRDFIIREYKRVLRELYDPNLKTFFALCLTMFEHLKHRRRIVRIRTIELRAFMKSIWRQLLSRKQGPTYLLFLIRVLLRYPHMFPLAVRMAIMGYHYEKITHQQVAIDDFKQYLTSELDTFKKAVSQFANAQSNRIGEIDTRVQELFARVRKQYEEIHEDFRYAAQGALDVFEKSVGNQSVKLQWRDASYKGYE